MLVSAEKKANRLITFSKCGSTHHPCWDSKIRGLIKSNLGPSIVSVEVHCMGPHCSWYQISAGANAPATPVPDWPLILQKDEWNIDSS